jgi:hypothetical protein
MGEGAQEGAGGEGEAREGAPAARAETAAKSCKIGLKGELSLQNVYLGCEFNPAYFTFASCP